MSLDTKFRPQHYDDVLGQDATKAVLKGFVSMGKGFEQSYLFAGAFGSGKTTLGRILARALLCDAPVGGEPCDKCSSCQDMLRGASETFFEVDAATNSGKADVKKIIDEIRFDTFSGKRRIYLFDECFTADTVLQTPTGLRSIKDLVRNKSQTQVWARDLDRNTDCWSEVQQWFDHGEREVLELDFGGGLILRVTENQLFYTTNRRWVSAQDLTCDDDVVAVPLTPCREQSSKDAIVVRLQSKRRLGPQRVYDVQTSTGNFFAKSSDFQGNQSLLVHNSHQLSKDALDALLKPLEEDMQDTYNKKLVCIFCTTEPEKMRNTILSRCAPAFVVKQLTPEVIAGRLKVICDAEGISYDYDALETIAQVTECHMRDAIKAVEGVRMLGGVSAESVSRYLDLDLNGLYLDVLEKIAEDLPDALRAATKLFGRVSPSTCYRRLADVAMMAYQTHLGAGALRSFWDQERVTSLASRGDVLLGYASRFATRPGRPTEAMLLCDIASLHQFRGAVKQAVNPTIVRVAASTSSGESSKTVIQLSRETFSSVGKLSVPTELRGGGVHVDPRAVRKGDGLSITSSTAALEAPLFCRLLGLAITQDGDTRGSKRQTNMDCP